MRQTNSCGSTRSHYIHGSICGNVPENQVKSNIGDILENEIRAPRAGARYSQDSYSHGAKGMPNGLRLPNWGARGLTFEVVAVEVERDLPHFYF